jgi:hypothetical protein
VGLHHRSTLYDFDWSTFICKIEHVRGHQNKLPRILKLKKRLFTFLHCSYDIIPPLQNGYFEEEKEDKVYNIPFVVDEGTLVISLNKK